MCLVVKNNPGITNFQNALKDIGMDCEDTFMLIAVNFSRLADISLNSAFSPKANKPTKFSGKLRGDTCSGESGRESGSCRR